MTNNNIINNNNPITTATTTHCPHFYSHFANSSLEFDSSSSPLLHTNYVTWLTCLGPVGFIPLLLVLLAFLLFLKSTADDFLSGTLSVICIELQLSHEIAGATLLALGNGAPDVFSSIAAFSSNSADGSNADLGIASLLGGAAFVTTIVLGSVAISVPEDAHGVEIKLETFGRDALFLVAGVIWLVILSQTMVNIFTSFIFLILEAIYVFIVVRQARSNNPKNNRCFNDDEQVEESLLSMESTSLSTNENNTSNPRQRLLQGDDEEDSPHGVFISDSSSLVGNNNNSNNNILVNENHFGIVINSSGLPSSPNNPFAPLTTITSSNSSGMDNTTTTNIRHPPSFFNALYWRQLRVASHTRLKSMETYKEFAMLSYWGKFLAIIQAPLNFLRALTVPPPEAEGWSKPLVALHPPMCILFVIWVHGNITDVASAGFIIFIIILILSLLSSILIYCNLHSGRPPTSKSARLILSFTSFCMCVIWIEVSATEIVSILDTIGTALGANASVMGLSVLAWGNSIGDLINNVSVAKAGFPAMAVSACVAGPVFNVLVGLGLSLMVFSIKRHAQSLGSFHFDLDKYSAAAAWLLVSVLSFTLIIARLNQNRISKKVGMFLVCTYLMFIVGAIIVLIFV
jgi:sodium/potassium/calcium exchanger 6